MDFGLWLSLRLAHLDKKLMQIEPRLGIFPTSSSNTSSPTLGAFASSSITRLLGAYFRNHRPSRDLIVNLAVAYCYTCTST